MTMQLQSETEELFSISETEKKQIDKMSSINVLDTKKFNPNRDIDHCIFQDDSGVFCLIAHGHEELHKVWFNQKWRTVKEVSQLLRSELSIGQHEFVVCRIYCCHGGLIEGYYDEHNLFLCAFNNKPALNLIYTSTLAKFSYAC